MMLRARETRRDNRTNDVGSPSSENDSLKLNDYPTLERSLYIRSAAGFLARGLDLHDDRRRPAFGRDDEAMLV